MQDLISSVQYNCDVSDAQHAADAAMCIYLMRMREHYKWLKDIPGGGHCDHKPLGQWIHNREEYLSSLQDADYTAIDLDGVGYDPFDHHGINQHLSSRGLVYCAGYGRSGKPVFCLGEIVDTECTADYEMYIIGKEFAREASAPAAMSLGNTIYIRQDAFMRLVWEMFEEWSWRKPRNAFYKAIAAFGEERDAKDATQALVTAEIESLILHEIGEVVAGGLLGEKWREMLLCLTDTSWERSARAVRDNLADSITLLPALICQGNASSIHFYFAGFHSTRSELYPALYEAYRIWDETRALAPLKAVLRRGQKHWLETARKLISCYEQRGDGCAPCIQRVIAESSL